MIRSMTGFGRYELISEGHRITVEMKSVNHRYLDLSIKMPRIFNCFEAQIRNTVKEYLQRGKVDMYISYETEAQDGSALKYNESVAREYVGYMKQMAETFDLPYQVSVSSLSRMPEVFSMEQKDTDASLLWPDIETAVKEACRAILVSRENEGEHLRTDLLAKLTHMEELVAVVNLKAPDMVKEYRQRLLDKVKEYLEDASLDENRLAAEVTIFADKVCVDEEMVRLRTHIQHMRDELCSGGGIGRKLDFLAQEMNREANTTLSKVNDVTLADIAIDMKTEIEKIREQVQNIE